VERSECLSLVMSMKKIAEVLWVVTTGCFNSEDAWLAYNICIGGGKANARRHFIIVGLAF